VFPNTIEIVLHEKYKALYPDAITLPVIGYNNSTSERSTQYQFLYANPIMHDTNTMVPETDILIDSLIE